MTHSVDGRYLSFDREAWADLRAATPLTLRESELRDLRGINDRIDLDEVAAVYLPLTRLLNLYVAGAGLATIAAGWALGLAFRFRDMRAAALMQLTLFNALFLTNAQTPLFIMSGWVHSIARVNPFTNILRLARTGFLGDVTWNDTWGGLVAIVGLSALTLWFARRGLAKLSE